MKINRNLNTALKLVQPVEFISNYIIAALDDLIGFTLTKALVCFFNFARRLWLNIHAEYQLSDNIC